MTGVYDHGRKQGAWSTRHKGIETIVYYERGRRMGVKRISQDRFCAAGSVRVMTARRSFHDSYCRTREGVRHGRYHGAIGKTIIQGRYVDGKRAGRWEYQRGDALTVITHDAGQRERSQQFYYAGLNEWRRCPAPVDNARAQRLCAAEAATTAVATTGP